MLHIWSDFKIFGAFAKSLIELIMIFGVVASIKSLTVCSQ